MQKINSFKIIIEYLGIFLLYSKKFFWDTFIYIIYVINVYVKNIKFYVTFVQKTNTSMLKNFVDVNFARCANSILTLWFNLINFITTCYVTSLETRANRAPLYEIGMKQVYIYLVKQWKLSCNLKFQSFP